MAEPILELEALTKRYGKIVPADRISLSVDRGEFFTLLGPSGSGKSTVLRLVAGLEQPDQGEMRIAGRAMSGVAPWHRNLGMVFQNYALFPHMNVEENVGYTLRVHKVRKDEIRRRVAELLTLVGLEGREKADVAVLSGGQQQRVALARGLALNPPLLLLDEPLGALDEKIRRDMQTELKHVQQETGTTFIYVTHDQEEALTMSDRIAVMHSGRIAQCDRPEVIFRQPQTRFVASFFRGCNILEGSVLEVRSDQMRVRIGDIELSVPARGLAAPVGSRIPLGLRAENVHIGWSAERFAVYQQALLVDVIYRGLTTDYLLQLGDGQRLVSTTTQSQIDATLQDIVRFGLNPEDLLVLKDDEASSEVPAENIVLLQDHGDFRAARRP